MSQLPLTVAANALTLYGMLVNIAITLLLVAFYPNITADEHVRALLGCTCTDTRQAPAWVFFAVALAVFNYQLFDAIDGKQVCGAAFG